MAPNRKPPKRTTAPRPRAPKGTGTVFYSKRRKCYVARKPIGTKRTAGGRKKTLYLERTGATEREAIRRRDAALPPGPKTTVAEWADRWLEGAEVREQTRDDYRNTIERRLKPLLGHLAVAAVTAYDLERARGTWGRAPDGASANTVRKYLQHTRAIFAAAVRAKLRPDNPASAVKKPKKTKVEIDPFGRDELATIVRTAAADPKLARVAVMAAIGCRAGEAIALDPSDYDPATGELSISRTLTGRYGRGPTKSANSTRTVRVPAAARKAASALGPAYSHHTLADRWYALLERLNLRRRNPHQARHSVATHALANGVPLANVARDLGDTAETIVRTYVHAVPGRDVCSAMDELLGGHKVAKNARPATAPQKKQVPRRRAS